jgi:hypothetical protein
MRVGFSNWWLLPFGILAASALVVLGIVAFEPPFGYAADCSGASATDYACYQDRYKNLVRSSGVEVAFTELKNEHEKNGFVKLNCHQLAHVIGRTAAELYGDVPSTYGRGDYFCESGYYHGAMETIVAKIGAENMLEEVGTLCADLREHQEHSPYHFNCVHGLGHGFMGVLQNELFEALETCDALTDGWEREQCYGGVFMENIMAEDNPGRPSKYLKADQPLYPCTDVQARYKNPCYERQTTYALWTQSYDFAKVFDLCASVEEDFRPACYQSLGRNAAIRSILDSVNDTAKAKSTSRLCMLGDGYAARSNCVDGAAKYFVYYYDSDEEVKELCGSLDDTDLRAGCFRTAEEQLRKGPQPQLEL